MYARENKNKNYTFIFYIHIRTYTIYITLYRRKEAREKVAILKMREFENRQRLIFMCLPVCEKSWLSFGAYGIIIDVDRSAKRQMACRKIKKTKQNCWSAEMNSANKIQTANCPKNCTSRVTSPRWNRSKSKKFLFLVKRENYKIYRALPSRWLPIW